MIKKDRSNLGKLLVGTLAILLSLILGLSGCASRMAETETATEVKKQTLPLLTNGSETADLWEQKFVTAEDVGLMFQKYYSELGHAGRNQLLAEEIEGLIQRIRRCHEEIIAGFNDRAERVINHFKKYDSTMDYNHYYESIIRPYEDYYNARMGLGETIFDLHLDIAAIRHLGGNSSGDSALCQEYAYYQNFLCELLELRDDIKLPDYMK